MYDADAGTPDRKELVPPLAWATGHAWIYLTASIPAFVGREVFFCARARFHERGV